MLSNLRVAENWPAAVATGVVPLRVGTFRLELVVSVFVGTSMA